MQWLHSSKSVLCLISYFCMIVCTSVIIYLFCNVLQFKPIWVLSMFLKQVILRLLSTHPCSSFSVPDLNFLCKECFYKPHVVFLPNKYHRHIFNMFEVSYEGDDIAFSICVILDRMRLFRLAILPNGVIFLQLHAFNSSLNPVFVDICFFYVVHIVYIIVYS